MQTTNEIKLQKMLVVKSKLQKARERTKAAHKAAKEQLTLQNKYKEEQEVSSECQFEEGSSFDFLQEGEVEQALLDKNETILSNEMNY